MEGRTGVNAQLGVYAQLELLTREYSEPLIYLAAASEFIDSQIDNAPESLKRHLAQMKATSQRLLALQESWLLRQGVIAGQHQIAFEPVNVGAIAHRSLQKMQRLHQKEPAHDYIPVSHEAWPAVSDRRILTAAMEALCDVLTQTNNTNNYELRVVRRERIVQLEIVDDGPVLQRKDLRPRNENLNIQPFKESNAFVAVSLSVARDLISAVNGHLSIAKTASKRRSSIVKLPMTSQLDLLGV